MAAMTPKVDGFYWLLAEGREPTIGRWSNAAGWAIIGETLELDPGDPVDAEDLSKYILGEMITPRA